MKEAPGLGSRRRDASRGFTFIEVLIVVAIIGILVNLMMPVAFDQLTKARAAAVVGEYELIESALEQFAAEHKVPPRSWFSVSPHPDLAPYLNGRLSIYDPDNGLCKWFIRYPDSFESPHLRFRSGYIIYSLNGASRLVEAIEDVHDGPIEVLSPGRLIVLITEPS